MKNELKIAKANHKEALKNIYLYDKERKLLIKQILSSATPNWDSLKIIIDKKIPLL